MRTDLHPHRHPYPVRAALTAAWMIGALAVLGHELAAAPDLFRSLVVTPLILFAGAVLAAFLDALLGRNAARRARRAQPVEPAPGARAAQPARSRRSTRYAMTRSTAGSGSTALVSMTSSGAAGVS